MNVDRVLRSFPSAFLALLAVFSGQDASALEDPVLGKVTHVWPKFLGQGYFPLWVELRNLTDKVQPVEVSVSCGMGDDETSARKSVELAAGETREVELFAPVFDQGSGGWSWGGFEVSMSVARSKYVLDTSLVERTEDANLRTVLVLGARVRDEATETSWSSALSTGTLSAWTTTGTGTPNVDVASARFDEHVPSYAEAYSSLDLVVLDVSQSAPDEEALGALLRWVRLGGRLLVVGEKAEAEARAIGALAPWMEERFEAELGFDGTSAYTCGHGLLLVCPEEGDALEAPAHLRVIRRVLDGSIALLPTRVPDSARSPMHPIAIPGVGELPYEIFLVLLLGFAIVIGPVNFLVLRKLDKPFLLLVTVPAISLLASLAIFVYGAFAQGFGAKAASHSLTLLDQRTGWASTVEQHAAYFPLAPAAGLRPEAGTSIFPLVVEGQRRFGIDLSKGILLANGFLPVRTQLDHLALSDRPAHLQIRFGEADGAFTVHNELGVAIERLILRDPDGGTHALESAVEPGGTGTLVPAEKLDAIRLANDLLAHDLLADRPLVPSTFLAELRDAPFLDDCGVEVELLASDHVLYGVLPLRKEEW